MPRPRRSRKPRDLAPREDSPTFTRDVRIPLTHEAIETKARELAEATLRRNATAEQAKLVAREARASVKAADAEVAALAAVVASGAETRPIECRTIRHVAAGVFAVVRCDGAPESEAVVEIREMTVDEQQLHIGEPLLAEDPALVAEIERRAAELTGNEGAVPALDHALAIVSGETAVEVDPAVEAARESAANVEAFFAGKEPLPDATNPDVRDALVASLTPPAAPPSSSSAPAAEAARERDPWEADEPEAPQEAVQAASEVALAAIHHAAATVESADASGDLFGDLDAGEEPPAVVVEPSASLPPAQPVGPPTPFPISDASDVDVPLEKVRGVGPKAAEALRKAGYGSLRKLRMSQAEDLSVVEIEGGERVGIKKATEVYYYVEMHYPEVEEEWAIDRVLPGGALPGSMAGAAS